MLLWVILLFLCVVNPYSTTARMVPNDDGDEEEGMSEKRKRVVNFASVSAGAVVLESSAQSTKFHNLLNDDKDKYGMTQCSEKKWVVLGLSEDILIENIVMVNYERYSSTLETFQVLGSTSYPVSEWMDLGTFTATPDLGEQNFALPNPAWGRYLKFRFLTHHGNEFYCTLSQIRVHGSTVIENLQKEVDRSTLEVLHLDRVMLEHDSTDSDGSSDNSSVDSDRNDESDSVSDMNGDSNTDSSSDGCDVSVQQSIETRKEDDRIIGEHGRCIAMEGNNKTSHIQTQGDEDGVDGDASHDERTQHSLEGVNDTRISSEHYGKSGEATTETSSRSGDDSESSPSLGNASADLAGEDESQTFSFEDVSVDADTQEVCSDGSDCGEGRDSAGRKSSGGASSESDTDAVRGNDGTLSELQSQSVEFPIKSTEPPANSAAGSVFPESDLSNTEDSATAPSIPHTGDGCTESHELNCCGDAVEVEPVNKLDLVSGDGNDKADSGRVREGSDVYDKVEDNGVDISDVDDSDGDGNVHIVDNVNSAHIRGDSASQSQTEPEQIMEERELRVDSSSNKRESGETAADITDSLDRGEGASICTEENGELSNVGEKAASSFSDDAPRELLHDVRTDFRNLTNETHTIIEDEAKVESDESPGGGVSNAAEHITEQIDSKDGSIRDLEAVATETVDTKNDGTSISSHGRDIKSGNSGEIDDEDNLRSNEEGGEVRTSVREGVKEDSNCNDTSFTDAVVDTSETLFSTADDVTVASEYVTDDRHVDGTGKNAESNQEISEGVEYTEIVTQDTSVNVPSIADTPAPTSQPILSAAKEFLKIDSSSKEDEEVIDSNVEVFVERISEVTSLNDSERASHNESTLGADNDSTDDNDNNVHDAHTISATSESTAEILPMAATNQPLDNDSIVNTVSSPLLSSDVDNDNSQNSESELLPPLDEGAGSDSSLINNAAPAPLEKDVDGHINASRENSSHTLPLPVSYAANVSTNDTSPTGLSNSTNSSTAQEAANFISSRIRSTAACLDALKFSDFQAKMKSKLNSTGFAGSVASGGVANAGAGGGVGSGGMPMGGMPSVGGSPDVFRSLMQKITSLDQNSRIFELYTAQIHECYQTFFREMEAENSRQEKMSRQKSLLAEELALKQETTVASLVHDAVRRELKMYRSAVNSDVYGGEAFDIGEVGGALLSGSLGDGFRIESKSVNDNNPLLLGSACRSPTVDVRQWLKSAERITWVGNFVGFFFPVLVNDNCGVQGCTVPLTDLLMLSIGMCMILFFILFLLGLSFLLYIFLK